MKRKLYANSAYKWQKKKPRSNFTRAVDVSSCERVWELRALSNERSAQLTAHTAFSRCSMFAVRGRFRTRIFGSRIGSSFGRSRSIVA